MDTLINESEATRTQVAFKEWAIVCDEMGSGRQSLILRKGGIAEGRKGFSFEHDAFFLFPTLFHEQVKMTNLPAETPIPPAVEDRVEIKYYVTVDWACLITEWDKVLSLAEFHCFTEKTLRDRFDYDEIKGIYAAFVRVHQLQPAAVIPNEKRYGGCRSWTNLLPAIPGELTPVLGEAEHLARRLEIEQRLGLNEH